jgi:hypothetical protein
MGAIPQTPSLSEETNSPVLPPMAFIVPSPVTTMRFLPSTSPCLSAFIITSINEALSKMGKVKSQ